MPADVILEMRVKWGRNGIGERRNNSPTVGWDEIASFLSLFSPRGTPKSHLRIRESGQKQKKNDWHVGWAPPNLGTVMKEFIPLSTDVTQIVITISPKSCPVVGQKLASGPPNRPRSHPKLPGIAGVLESILFQRILIRN